MSDPTKKSIVINKSFLSGSAGSSSSHAQNKKSKKNTRNLSEEIIKPNKLKKMLLDKINAKRKAEHSSPDSSLSGSISSSSNSNNTSNNTNTLDISKETKIFSSEFKKSLDFLDSYIGQKKTDRYNQKTKTLKKQNPSSPSTSPSTSLNNDILKSLHSNNITPNIHASRSPNSINQSLPPQGYITQPMQHQHQHRQATQQHIVAPTPTPTPTHAPLHRPQQTPIFQKIELQIPNKPHHSISPNILPNTVPKINLAIGKPGNSTFVYTELPPELQNFTPPVYNISSVAEGPMTLETLPALDSYHKPIDVIDSRDNVKIDVNNNNSELLDIATSMENDADSMNMIDSSSTSLFPTSTTFSPIKLSDDTPYGCLKDGKKPTFRMYNKTIKNNTRFSADNESNQDSTYSERQTKLKDLKNRHNKKASTISQNGNAENENAENENAENENGESDSNENRNSHSLRKTKIRRRLRKTITKKFKLGKQAGNVVGVWIKNNDTRKNIQKEQGLLKSKQLGEVKKYLVEKNLIKIGSTAPPGVIRNIYEASMLSGEVENIGKGVGLHNFLEDKKAW
jgi:hypothetical protein